VLCCFVEQARRWVKEAVESGKFKPKVMVAAAAAAAAV
jgi:hypothetical protein